MISHRALTINLLASLCACRPGLVMVLAAVLFSSCGGSGPQPLVRVNCGGEEIAVRGGIPWQADEGWSPGGTVRVFDFEDKAFKTEGAADPGPEALYATARIGRSLRYEFRDLPPGRCRVRLHFAEEERGTEHHMDFWLGETRVLMGFAPEEAATAPRQAYVAEFIADTSPEGALTVRGEKASGSEALLCGIEILPAPPDTPLSAHLEPAAAQPASEIARRLREIGDGAVRLVWTRTEAVDDPFQKEDSGQLWGFDTEDGKGERVILDNLGSYARPLFTDDGRRVIFSDLADGTCHVVNFDGSGLATLAEGYAGDVWRDPASGVEWVYIREGRRNTAGPVRRHRLDDPSVSEVVWTATESGQEFISYLQISGDGQRAVDVFPYPMAGMANLAEADYTPLARGCWPGVAPDESERSWVLQGSHSGLTFFDRPGAKPRSIALNTIPEFPGRSVYHPRWSNDVGYLTVTAPEWRPETELYLGRFDPDFTKVAEWVRVTYNAVPDYFGDAWLARAAGKAVTSAPTPPAPASGARAANPWPGLVYAWRSADDKNGVLNDEGKLVRTCSLDLHGQAVWTRWFGASLQGGGFTADLPGIAAATEATRASSAASLAFACLPTSTTPTPRTVLEWKGLFRVEQRGAEFWLTAPGLDLDLGQAKPGERVHLAIAIDPSGQVSAWRDGQPLASSITWNRDWSAPEPEPALTGGLPSPGEPGWMGELEDLRLFDRAIESEVVSQLAGESRTRGEGREPLPTAGVKARLLSAAAPADPAAIAPYRRSLATCVYEVTEIKSGDPGVAVGEKIIVMHWAVLGGRLSGPLPQPGDTRDLRLEELDSHPEIEGEHSTSETDEFLPRFLDVGPLPAALAN